MAISYYISLKILKLNHNSAEIEFIPKRFFQIVLSFYSIGISKNMWKNYSIQIGNNNKNKHTNIIFYMKNFSYPIIKIKYYNSQSKKFIEIDNNIKQLYIKGLQKNSNKEFKKLLNLRQDYEGPLTIIISK